MATEWEIDCTFWYGEPLVGKYAHWCGEWDDLPIDETCMEFMACICYPSSEEITEIKDRLQAKFNAEWKGVDYDDQECGTTSKRRIL